MSHLLIGGEFGAGTKADVLEVIQSRRPVVDNLLVKRLSLRRQRVVIFVV